MLLFLGIQLFKFESESKLKRNQRADASWPENRERAQLFSSAGFLWFFCYYYQHLRNKNNFPLQIWPPLGAAILVPSANEEQKKAGSWRIWYFWHTCWPCSWRHWHKLLGKKWQHSWLCFHDCNPFTAPASREIFWAEKSIHKLVNLLFFRVYNKPAFNNAQFEEKASICSEKEDTGFQSLHFIVQHIVYMHV